MLHSSQNHFDLCLQAEILCFQIHKIEVVLEFLLYSSKISQSALQATKCKTQPPGIAHCLTTSYKLNIQMPLLCSKVLYNEMPK